MKPTAGIRSCSWFGVVVWTELLTFSVVGTGYTHINVYTVHTNTHTLYTYVHTNTHMWCTTQPHMLLQNPYAPAHRDMYTAFNRPVYQNGVQPFWAKWRRKRGRERGQTHNSKCLLKCRERMRIR